jgi:hypothetical protein
LGALAYACLKIRPFLARASILGVGARLLPAKPTSFQPISSIRMKMKFGRSEAWRVNGMIRRQRRFLNIMIASQTGRVD